MRILLDHCVPVDLAPHIRGHEVTSVRAEGWQRLDDGELLEAMAGRYDILIANRPYSVIILRAKSSRVGQLARLVPELMRILKSIRPGEVREVNG